MPEFNVTFILPDNTLKQISVNQTEDILDAALDAGIELPFRCLQGWCLSCAVKIVSGEIDQNDSKRFFKEDREDHFALICTGKARSDVILKTHAKEEMKASRKKNHLPYPKGNWGD